MPIQNSVGMNVFENHDLAKNGENYLGFSYAHEIGTGLRSEIFSKSHFLGMSMSAKNQKVPIKCPSFMNITVLQYQMEKTNHPVLKCYYF